MAKMTNKYTPKTLPDNTLEKNPAIKTKGRKLSPKREEEEVEILRRLERLALSSDDAYRIRETIQILLIFGYSIREIKGYLITGEIPLAS